jgi:hypothetical protein
MGQRVAHRAMHLRDAAQRIRILHAAAVAMRIADLALFEQAAQVRSGLDLSGMGSSLLNALVESDVGSLERIARHGADDIGRRPASRRPAASACRWRAWLVCH